MPNLFDGLRSSVNALRATGEAIAITQINLTNTGVAGYAKRNVIQQADAFDFNRGFAGGMRSQSSSARNQYAEQAVWTLTSQKGFLDGFTQAANGVDAVLGGESLDGQSGLQGSLAGLFQSFNKLRQGPSEKISQEDVVQKSRAFAMTLSQTADFLAQSGSMARERIQIAVSQINGIVKGVQQWNSQMAAGSEPDPIAEAKLYAALETLSSLVPINVQKESNGSLTIILNGQTPLLQGAVFSPISVSFVAPDPTDPFPEADAKIRILDASGEEVPDIRNGGQLGGLIEYVNRFLPTLLGDADQQGDLNRMAEAVASSVNAAIGGSTPLFLHDANPTAAARTVMINPDFSSQTLETAITGNPTALSNLTEIAKGAVPTNQLDGQSYSQFFVTLAARVAMDVSTAKNGQTLRNGLVEQARTFRETVQGASIEESAVALLEYQRAYEAAAKVISVIDELTKTTMEMLR